MKEKMKSYSFWISVAGAVVLLINNVGQAFGFSIDSKIASDVINGVCGILVMFGILTMPKKKTDTETTKSNTSNTLISDKNLSKTDKSDIAKTQKNEISDDKK